MTLTHRPTTLQDLDACLPLVRNGFAFRPAERPTLLALWRHLVAGGIAESAVIEDQARPAGRRVVGFGLSVFVTEEFAAEAVTSLPPYLAPRVLSRWGLGRPPFLDAAQVRRANSAEGLNCLILHNGWAEEGKTVEENAPVRQKIVEAFFAHHGGYRLRRFLHEIYGAAERDRMVAAGWRVETDYARFPHAHSPEAAPFLVGFRREDVRTNAFSPFYPLFNCAPPHLFFRPAEQALLRRALLGESDAEIAAALALSPYTIHKRWRAVYEKVAEREPTLLPASGGLVRGAEKRSHLLRYLQHHPEELRPVSPPAGRG